MELRKEHWTVNVGTRVSPELKSQLEALANKAHKKLSAYVKHILEDHVAEKLQKKEKWVVFIFRISLTLKRG